MSGLSGRKDIPSLHAVWRWWPEAGGGYWVDDLGGRRDQDNRIAALEAALDRANEVARQTQEIVDLRAKRIAELEDDLRGEKGLTEAWQAWADARIAELETEVAALKDSNEHLRQMIYGHAANPAPITPDFPTAALAHSWATKGPR